MLSSKNSLQVLKKTRALLEGHFILSSGLHSTNYVQCAKLLSHATASIKFVKSLSKKIRKKFKKIDLILSPAMGGVIVGYEIGKQLKKEAIFCERVKKKFKLRRGFVIQPKSKVLIVEDVITTGKSSLECVELVKKLDSKVVGFACLIDRRNSKKNKLNKMKVVSQIKLQIPTFKKNKIPHDLKKIPAIKPGSRNLR